MGLLSWMFGSGKAAKIAEAAAQRAAEQEVRMQAMLEEAQTAARASRDAAEAASQAARAAIDAARQSQVPDEPVIARSVIADDSRVAINLAATPTGVSSVIGNDDRVPPAGLGQAPWCAICYLVCEFGNGTWVGTGWLINATTVITAGHNLWNTKLSAGEAKRAVGEVQKLTVVPAQADVVNHPKGAIVNPRYVWDKRWQTLGEPARRYYDYGAILLPAPGIKVPFYFTPYGASPAEWQSDAYSLLSCAGFPAAQNGSLLCGDGKPCKDTATNAMFIGPHQEMVVHDIDTTGGQSGAPIFWTSQNKDQYFALGIHTQGIGLAAGRNACIRLTPAMIATFEKWANSPTIQGAQTVA